MNVKPLWTIWYEQPLPDKNEFQFCWRMQTPIGVLPFINSAAASTSKALYEHSTYLKLQQERDFERLEIVARERANCKKEFQAYIAEAEYVR